MNCTEARERILEADLAELRETGDSALSKHIRLCAPCRTMAGRILRDELALARVLSEVPPRVEVERALLDKRRAAMLRRRRWTRLVPALAAAGLAGVLLTQAPILPIGGGPPASLPAEVLPVTPSVDPPSDRSVVVFETDNPNIVIIWLY
jgi:hypothetical protein